MISHITIIHTTLKTAGEDCESAIFHRMRQSARELKPPSNSCVTLRNDVCLSTWLGADPDPSILQQSGHKNTMRDVRWGRSGIQQDLAQNNGSPGTQHTGSKNDACPWLREEAKLTPLVSTLAYNASVSLAMNFKMLAKLTLCSFLSSTPTLIFC